MSGNRTSSSPFAHRHRHTHTTHTRLSRVRTYIIIWPPNCSQGVHHLLMTTSPRIVQRSLAVVGLAAHVHAWFAQQRLHHSHLAFSCPPMQGRASHASRLIHISMCGGQRIHDPYPAPTAGPVQRRAGHAARTIHICPCSSQKSHHVCMPMLACQVHSRDAQLAGGVDLDARYAQQRAYCRFLAVLSSEVQRSPAGPPARVVHAQPRRAQQPCQLLDHES
mmetsp:Transcript_322/g.765  ORF Transcript_322/g.765 Transcript_322/m.765 type:complete len:220 (-) Transcript_322:530-1189(-)